MKKLAVRLLVILIAVVLRFYDLGKAPFFFDESVHTVFVDSVLNGNYRYDPAFHGPLLFYLTAPIVQALGKTEFTYRIVPAIFGVLTVILIFKFERFIGRGADYSALLVAISPVIVNYSRFFRNDSQILFITLSFIYFTFSYLRDRKTYQLILASVSLSLFACSKENFYPIALLLLIYFVFDLKRFRVKDLTLATVAFLVVYLSIYTNFYTYLTPLTNFSEFPAVKAVSYWKHQHEIARIGGPLWYYIPILLLYDLPVFILALFAIFKWVRERKNDLRTFLIYWFVVNLVFYSYVQEKVPWLTVHIELPMYMIAGTFMCEIKKYRLPILVITVSFLLYSCVQLNIVNPTNPAEPALYLPTCMDVKAFREELKEKNVSSVCVFMSPGDYWPLPCYLKDFKTYYFPNINGFKDIVKSYGCEVVILNETNAMKVGDLKGYKRYELCLRSWTSYSYESLNPLKVVDFILFRRPMGNVCYFNHTVYMR